MTMDAESQADVDLLVIAIEALSTLQHRNFPAAYYSRLQLAMKWATKIALTVKEALQRDGGLEAGNRSESPDPKRSSSSSVTPNLAMTRLSSSTSYGSWPASPIGSSTSLHLKRNPTSDKGHEPSDQGWKFGLGGFDEMRNESHQSHSGRTSVSGFRMPTFDESTAAAAAAGTLPGVDNNALLAAQPMSQPGQQMSNQIFLNLQAGSQAGSQAPSDPIFDPRLYDNIMGFSSGTMEPWLVDIDDQIMMDASLSIE